MEKLLDKINTSICKSKILAASNYCLHNQLKFQNSIELGLIKFIIQLRAQMFKHGDSWKRQKLNGCFFKKFYSKIWVGF